MVLEYTITLWVCKARKGVMGLAGLLRLVSLDSRLVVDSLKETASAVREFKVEAK